jgi:hypothetical protein
VEPYCNGLMLMSKNVVTCYFGVYMKIHGSDTTRFCMLGFWYLIRPLHHWVFLNCLGDFGNWQVQWFWFCLNTHFQEMCNFGDSLFHISKRLHVSSLWISYDTMWEMSMCTRLVNNWHVASVRQHTGSRRIVWSPLPSSVSVQWCTNWTMWLPMFNYVNILLFLREKNHNPADM